MPLFREKTEPVEATQWFKNGDHPKDYVNDRTSLEGEVPIVIPAAACREKGWEGEVVRRFRLPDVPGFSLCQKCQERMHDHGWIDEGGDGVDVCPGDWVVTNEDGTHSVYAPGDFLREYEPVQ